MYKDQLFHSALFKNWTNEDDWTFVASTRLQKWGSEQDIDINIIENWF